MNTPEYADADGTPISKETHDRRVMVEQARQVGENQRRSQRVMQELQSAPHLADMVPEAYRHNPAAYLNSMADKGRDTGERRVIDSNSAGALPIDNNILKGARNGPFECAPSSIRGDSVVSYRPHPGAEPITMKVDDAVRAGLLEPNGKGGFQVPGAETLAERSQAEQAEKAEEQRQRAAELDAKRLSGDEHDAKLQEAIEIARSYVPVQAQAALIEDAISNGDVSMEALTQVSKAAGLTETQGQGIVHALWTGYERQAAAAVRSVGVPADEVQAVWNYMAERYPTDHKNAIRSMVMLSDTSTFKKIARSYMAHRRSGGR